MIRRVAEKESAWPDGLDWGATWVSSVPGCVGRECLRAT
jgi:hypothetical protein